MKPAIPSTIETSGERIEKRIAGVGQGLGASLAGIIDAIPGGPHGPVQLARTLGIDKVLASRILKTIRNNDPIAVLHLAPGPDPLRRFLKAASRRKVDKELVATASKHVTEFEDLIREEAGDRSALDAMICAWLPEARADFELRRRQSAYRAMSQLKGAAANTILSTVIVYPSKEGKFLDIVWIHGYLGLRRLRAGAAVAFSSRRIGPADSPRRPRTIDGEPITDFEGVRVSAFCSKPHAQVNAHHVGEVIHYTLAGNGFGPKNATDLITAEVNPTELPIHEPQGSRRKRYVFAEVATPVKVLVFDALIHQSVYPGADPVLHVYDTVLNGVADVNDPSRDIDRLNHNESAMHMGQGISGCRSADVPNYLELLREITGSLNLNDQEFRGYRCRIEYPIYGSQVVMAFDTARGQSG